jgi:hypothetical protein
MDKNLNLRKYSIITSIFSILMAIFAIFGEMKLHQELIVKNNIDQTILNFKENINIVQIGIISFFFIIICDMIVSWSIHIILSKFNKSLSLMAAWFRIIYTSLLSVSIFFLYMVYKLIIFENSIENKKDFIFIFIELFENGWSIGFLLFGIHLILIGYLFLKSNYIPNLISLIIIFAGFSYFIDNLFKLMFPIEYLKYSNIFLICVASSSMIGEIGLAFYLLFFGTKDKKD